MVPRPSVQPNREPVPVLSAEDAEGAHEILDVDGEGHLRWLETGEGEPWPIATVHDVAAFIEGKLGRQPAVGLQKLVYYAQAWSLAWTGAPLFADVVEAWKLGPVCPELWRHRAGGNPDRLTSEQARTVSAVLDFYGPMSAKDLIGLSHREAPWRDARKGLGPADRGGNAISLEAMRGYYGPMATAGERRIPDAVARGMRLLLATPEDEVDSLFDVDPVDGEAATQWLEGIGADPWQG